MIALFLAYLWVQTPWLREMSLQISALLFLIYFLSKRLQKTKWHYVMPQEETLEASLLLAAVAIVVGSSGGLASPFLPLFYLLLFVSVLTLHLYTNLVEMVTLMVFLWAVTPAPITTDHLIEIISLPLLLPLMLFARWQFEEAQEDRYRLEQEENLLASQETNILMFLSTYLQPKLQQLRGMLYVSELNRPSVIKQLEMLEQETQALIKDIDVADDLDSWEEPAPQNTAQPTSDRSTSDKKVDSTDPVAPPATK